MALDPVSLFYCPEEQFIVLIVTSPYLPGCPNGHVIQVVKSPCCLLGPFKCHPLCANRSGNSYKCPLYSSLHFFLMTQSEGLVSQALGTKTALSWSLCACGAKALNRHPSPPSPQEPESRGCPRKLSDGLKQGGLQTEREGPRSQ